MKGGGGKKKKRGKNNNNITKPFIEPTINQYFAKVIKNMGSCRFQLDVYFYKENEKDNTIEFNKETKLGIVRGNMLKRHYVNADDIVLVSKRDFEKAKVDILLVYKSIHHNKIKHHKYAPSQLIEDSKEGEVSFSLENDSASDEDILHTKTNTKKQYKNNTNYMADMDLPSMVDEIENSHYNDENIYSNEETNSI